MRLKRGIARIDSPLETVARLRGVTFMWRTEEYPSRYLDSKRHHGFLSQEMEDVLPDLVEHDHEGYGMIRYQELTALLVEALKEQQGEIASLRERIQGLEKRMAAE